MTNQDSSCATGAAAPGIGATAAGAAPPDGSAAGVDRGRRTALKVAGAAGLAAAFGRGARAQDATELTFAFGPDDSGSLARLVDAFNAEHEGRIRVTYREMARESDDYYRQLRSDFEVGAGDIDVFGADIIWTAEFATRDWVQDLTGAFADGYERDDFLRAPLRTARYRRRVYGVPWYTDVGVLFYRRDLLEANGFDAPPSTWEALGEMALAVREAEGVEHGLVFQGAEYEGGVANALEFIWNAGGRVLTGNVSVAGNFGQGVIDPNVIVVDNRDAARGLDTARRLVADGVAPEAVTEFRELETHRAFLGGDAVFMRNWPFAYGLFGTEGVTLEPEQVGIAPIPLETGGRGSYSCLGGWNLMLAAGSPHREAALEFIRFATAPERQRRRAIEGGFLPTLAALYDDEALLAEAPVLGVARDVIANARARPVSPYYASLSPRLARAFNLVLRGELDGREAVGRLQREMDTILRRSR